MVSGVMLGSGKGSELQELIDRQVQRTLSLSVRPGRWADDRLNDLKKTRRGC
jgi:hypothetical protein